MAREVCEAYPGISPLTIQDMTFDQLRILVQDKKRMGRGRRFITGTPQELAAMGLIPPQPARSLASQLAEQEERERSRADELRAKRARRRALRRTGR